MFLSLLELKVKWEYKGKVCCVFCLYKYQTKIQTIQSLC
jgi:hypothetical protein